MKILLTTALAILFCTSLLAGVQPVLVKRCITTNLELMTELSAKSTYLQQTGTFEDHDLLHLDLIRVGNEYQVKILPIYNNQYTKDRGTLRRLIVQTPTRDIVSVHYARYSEAVGGGRNTFLLTIVGNHGSISFYDTSTYRERGPQKNYQMQCFGN